MKIIEKFIDSYPKSDIIGEKERQNEEKTVEYPNYLNYMKSQEYMLKSIIY